MSSLLSERYPFNIRYVKLIFTLVMEKDCILPLYKSSAIRGGMGEMLLRANCIRNRDCKVCDFESECIVQRTMYSKFTNKPASVNEGDSIGYIINCEDRRTEMAAGEELSFTLTLFGKTIVYFNQYLNALYALGRNGLGKDKATFTVMSVKNSFGREIIDGMNVYMNEYRVSTLRDYVGYRLKTLEDRNPSCLEFVTPLSVKYQGEFIEDFNATAIIKALQRRIYILNCFEDNDAEAFHQEGFGELKLSEQSIKNALIPRFSSRQNSKMTLKGIYGKAMIEEVDDDVLPLLLAGELVHIGKNTSFGFGRIKVR